MTAESITVEVAFARLDEQVIVTVTVPAGATLADAIAQSRIGERFPEIDLQKHKVGVFGRLGKLDTVLQPGDRVEIYRPLVADPKVIRQQRAAAGKPMKKGG